MFFVQSSWFLVFLQTKIRAGSSAVDPSADGLLSSMFYTYILINELSGKIYIGQTNNLEKRVAQHNNSKFSLYGKNAYTKLNKGTWKLIYSENFETRGEAMKREEELKSSRGRNFIHTTILVRRPTNQR